MQEGRHLDPNEELAIAYHKFAGLSNVVAIERDVLSGQVRGPDAGNCVSQARLLMIDVSLH